MNKMSKDEIKQTCGIVFVVICYYIGLCKVITVMCDKITDFIIWIRDRRKKNEAIGKTDEQKQKAVE